MSTSFTRVCESFRRRLTPDLSNKFQYATLADLQDAIEEIQKAQAQRHGLRNLNKIKHFLNGLQQYAGVLEVFVQVKPDILGLIWGPIKFCLQVASKTINAFDALLDAYQKIGESLPIFSAVDDIFCSRPHVQQVLANVYEDILDFHKRSVVFFSHGTWRLTLKLAHHTFDDMFGEVLRNLERSKGLLMDAASLAHFHDAQQERLSWEKDYKERMERDQKTRMRTVVEWLSADKGHIDQQEALQKIRLESPQSGTWIYKLSPFKGWLREGKGKSLVFWLTGIPGAGKTVLFSSVIDQIHKSYPTSEIILFYCKADEPHKSTFNAIARSLISQMLQKDTGYLEYIYNTIIASQEYRPDSSALLKQILEAVVIYRNSLFVAIDGLDECEEHERSKILSFVSDVSQECDTEQNVKFFLTSRTEKDIKLSLNTAFSLNMEPDYIEDDIRAYVKLQTAKLSRKFDFDMAKESEIAKEVQTRPKGMFLLARLIMENLLIQDTMVELEEELRSDILPNGIDEAYGRLLVRIGKGRSGKIGPEKSRHRAALVLSFLATSKRPLTVNEIQGAISISLTDRTVDFNGRRLRDSFEELCGPIVESGLNGMIGLIHPTAKAYLLQKHSGPYMNSSDAEFKMAALCVSYLCFDCFCRETSQQDMEQYSANGSYAFQQYAVCNWIQHVQSLENCWELLDNSDCTLVYNASRVLLQLDLPHQAFEILPVSKLSKPPYTVLHKALCSLHDAYERTGSISDNGIPLAMKHVHQVRTAVEHLFSTSTNLQTSRLLTDSYGPLLFKCPIVKCPSFQQGFATQSARDDHYKVHEPPFTCHHQGCEYVFLGFLAETTLETHLRLCHDPISDQITFPKVKSRSVEDALNNAIDKDDLAAINHLAKELSSIVDRKIGFLMRAVQNGSQKSAILISKLLGTEAEFTHTVKRQTAISEAAKKGYSEVLKIFLNRCETLHIRDTESRALVEAGCVGHEAVARLLLDEGVVNVNDAKNGMTILHQAAGSGHEVMVRLLLERGANIAAKDKQGKTALYTAASKGNTAIVSLLLLSSSVDVMTKDNGMFSALHVAASSGHQAVVRLLLERGAGIDAKNSSRKTALHKAASSGREDVVRLLLDRNADITAEDNVGSTALHEAAFAGYETLVRLLLDKGAKSGVKTKSGKTALHEAARRGSETVVGLLLDRNADITAEDNDGLTALHEAAFAGYETLVRLLLDKGAKSEGKRKNRRTALHQAVSKKHEGVVRLLLDRNADITAEDDKGQTALHEAASAGSETIARLLLDKGAQTEAANNIGRRTALHQAAWGRHEAVVRLLLDRNADITAEENDGSTALHGAASARSETIARLLLDKGAKCGVKAKYGKTALHVAARYRNEAVVRLLLDRNADITAEDNAGLTALHETAFVGSETVTQLLLDWKADIAAKTLVGDTALHLAAHRHHEAIVQILLDRGADIAAQDNRGWTALHEAAFTGSKTVAQLLLDWKADIAAKTLVGDTALHLAAHRRHKTTVQILLDRGADVAAQDNRGWTALQLATKHGQNSPTAQLLRSVPQA